MEIYFETWIKEQETTEDAKVLFDESIMCYRVGAYRAAFLMSYLGFLMTLRDRLIRSETPELMKEQEGEWNKLIKKLKDDKKWEETVIQATQMKIDSYETNESKSKIFLITNDIREEIPFWRKKRNECAHAKDTIIGHSHVEMFWLFLQSNLSKFVVDGGKGALLDKINKHFDSKYTKPGSDFTHIIKEIPLVVKKSEIPELLEEIYNEYVTLPFNKNKQQHHFWEVIAYSPNYELNNAFLKFITSDDGIFAEFMEVFPDRLLWCAEKKELIRVFWKDLLFNQVGNFSHSFWELACSLLVNGLIPSEERTSFIKKLSSKLNRGKLPDEEQTMILKKFGIFKQIKGNLFESGDLNKSFVGYQNANNNAKKIIYYLKNESLDIKVVKELNLLFESYTFGDLYERMEVFIRKEPRFLYEFQSLAESEGLDLADYFKEKLSDKNTES